MHSLFSILNKKPSSRLGLAPNACKQTCKLRAALLILLKNGSTESSYSGNSVDAFDTLLSTLLARFLTYFRCLNWVLKEAGDQLRLPWEVCIRKHIPQLIITIRWKMVGTEGFEPTLSWFQTTRLSQTGLCPDIYIIWITLRRGQYQQPTN